MDTFVVCGVQPPIILLNAVDNLSAGTANLIATTSFVGGAAAPNAGAALNFTSIATINVGAALTADFTGGAVPTIAILNPTPTNIFFNGISINAPAAGVQSTVPGAVADAVASAGDAAEASFGTDSVGEQVANGSPSDIGTSPPGIDNVVDSGIRMPEVGETANDRKKREEAEERKRKLKVSQVN